MKFLFIIQGEGRGHLSQALALEEILKDNGHEVVKALVGRSSSHRLPAFFSEHIQAPVEMFSSPNFRRGSIDKPFGLLKRVFHNVVRIPSYLKSMCIIRRRISQSKPDLVINFYEILTGLTYLMLCPSCPYLSIGHQYMFLHPDFRFPLRKNKTQLAALRFFTRLTSARSKSRLALSFYPMSEVPSRKLIVLPPLLRKEIRTLHSESGDFIQGYLLRSSFATHIETYHSLHPEVKLRFFWNKKGAETDMQIDKGLSFHQIDEAKFIESLACCKAYATNAGFDSICEALYLGKPIMMVPSNVEQDCNAFDAVRAGVGIICDDFDIDRLLRFIHSYSPSLPFIYWTSMADNMLLREIEKALVKRCPHLLLSSLW